MKKHTVAEEVAIQLSNIGITQIFGITGDALNAFTNAIRIHDKIEWFTVRHEETASFAAAAQAEITQQLAVCAGTIGPGALHLINGLYNAKRDKCPVLCITGEVPTPETDGPYFQEINTDKAFDDICVFNATMTSASQMPRILQQAVSDAISKRGVAHIAIPTDISLTMIEGNAPIQLFEDNTPSVPTDSEIDELAALINQAKNISFLIGRGCRDAKQQVSKLAEKLSAPIAHSVKGTEAIDYNHPHSIGGIGFVGTPHGLAVLDECDLLLMLGTDFPYRAFLPKKCHIAQIDIKPEHLGRRTKIDIGVVGDIAITINALIDKVETRTNFSLKKLQKRRDEWLEKTEETYATKDTSKGPIHPQSIFLGLSKLANDDAIFTADIGETTVWIARYLKMHSKQRIISSFNHGSLGVALPAAIGAQALDRKRQVISISGDGGFGMLMADLITAARYELPITQIILNNGKFGFVELEMESSGMPRYATDLVNPDFTLVAKACGFEGITVTEPKELMGALTYALKTPKPVLLNIFINPSELLIPPKLDPVTAFKFMQGKVREMLIEKDIKVLFER
jgi:pyruvate dehydrogenase (quinone)